jgi:glycosyltransferase involved in cell wall biosynthesis
MSARMKLNGAQMHVVPLGIELDGRGPAELPFDPPVIGFLSKMCDDLGLGTLVDAFIELKRNPALAGLKLRATGGQHGPDVAYVKSLREKLRRAGLDGDVEFCEGFDLEHRREFLRSLTVLSVPARRGEAFGMYIVEALTEGVPVVQPDAGGYREVVERTGGGIVYDPNDPAGLVSALESVLLDRDRARQFGRSGREAVLREFGIDRMAQGIARVYDAVV